MKIIRSILTIFLLLSISSFSEAKIKMVNIPYIENGKSKQSNYTLISESGDGKAVVIYLKGGNGLFRWHQTLTPQKGVDKAVVNLGKKDIIVLAPDWPYDMDIKGGGSMMVCGKRCSEETNMRLLNVMEFAQKNYPNKPIWIIGHSNGTTSIEYFANYLKKLNRLSELKGAIISGIRSDVRIKLPELRLSMVNHIKDNCRFTSSDVAKFLYEIHKTSFGFSDNLSIDFIEGKNKPSGDCNGGSHTYEDAIEEATDLFRNIILREVK